MSGEKISVQWRDWTYTLDCGGDGYFTLQLGADPNAEVDFIEWTDGASERQLESYEAVQAMRDLNLSPNERYECGMLRRYLESVEAYWHYLEIDSNPAQENPFEDAHEIACPVEQLVKPSVCEDFTEKRLAELAYTPVELKSLADEHYRMARELSDAYGKKTDDEKATDYFEATSSIEYSHGSPHLPEELILHHIQVATDIYRLLDKSEVPADFEDVSEEIRKAWRTRENHDGGLLRELVRIERAYEEVRQAIAIIRHPLAGFVKGESSEHLPAIFRQALGSDGNIHILFAATAHDKVGFIRNSYIAAKYYFEGNYARLRTAFQKLKRCVDDFKSRYPKTATEAMLQPPDSDDLLFKALFITKPEYVKARWVVTFNGNGFWCGWFSKLFGCDEKEEFVVPPLISAK